MSFSNTRPNASHLWESPISPQQQRYSAQQENEQTWRRSQQIQPDELQQYGDYAQPGQHAQEPVDYNIYQKAVAVSSPRLNGVEGDIDPQASIRKTITRRVEVPFVRSVQVPTQTVQLVNTEVEQKVPVRRLVQTDGYVTVNEPFIEYEEREAIREREVWVKKIVPEKYVERVPVQKVRQVQKPTQVIREVETWEAVKVPTTKRVVVPGYTVQQVPDSRVVEVEEEQQFALRPEPVGPTEIKSTRDIGRLPNAHSHLPDAPYGAQPSGVPLSQSGYVPSRYAPHSPQQSTPSFGGSQGFNRPSSSYGTTFNPAPPSNPLESLRSYGMSVDETHTRHTDGTGCVITRVDRGSAAARAGLQLSDIVTAVAGRPTNTVAELTQMLQRAPGPVTLHVNRDGRRNIQLVFNGRQ